MRARDLLFGGVLAGFLGFAAAPASAAILVDQVPQGAFSVKTVPSQDVSGASFDAEAADEFTVPEGQVWTIEAVEGLGFANGGSAGTNTGRVRLYSDGGLAPAAELFNQSGIVLGGGTCTPGAQCDFSAPVSAAPALAPGTYWVSIQSVQGSPGYGWRQAVNPPQFSYGLSAVYRNPGGGYPDSCLTFTALLDCGLVSAGDGRDLYLRIHGKVVDSRFTLGQVTLAGKNLKLPATFPAPGRVSIKGKGIKPAKKSVNGGSTALKVKPKDGVKRKLARGKNAKVRIGVTFTATGGVAVKQTVKVRIISARAGAFRVVG